MSSIAKSLPEYAVPLFQMVTSIVGRPGTEPTNWTTLPGLTPVRSCEPIDVPLIVTEMLAPGASGTFSGGRMLVAFAVKSKVIFEPGVALGSGVMVCDHTFWFVFWNPLTNIIGSSALAPKSAQ